MIRVLASVVAAVTSASPFGLYHHVQASDLDRPEYRHEITANFGLVTIRGDGGATAGGLGELLKSRQNTRVILYRRGTAVSDDDVATLERDHPTWLARDQAGRLVTSNAGGTVIDITNAAVRDWLVTGLAADVKAGGYDGVYLDVLGAFFSERFYSARPVISGVPLTDTAWRDASVAVIKATKQATGKLVIANGFGLQSGKNYADHKADADQLIAAADGVQIEQFVRNGNMALNRYEPPARWREDVSFLETVGKMGKVALADTRVRATSDTAAVARQKQYALASFLLAAHGPASFRFAEGAATGTVDATMSQTIDALGEPIGDARNDGGSLLRQFANGQVSVDPVSHDATITINGPAPATRSTATRSTVPSRRSRTRAYATVAGALVVALGLLALMGSRRRRGR